MPGESLGFHISTNVGGHFSLPIYREGAARQLMTTIGGVTAGTADCTGKYATGCGWPAAISFIVPVDWPTGFYSVDIPIAGGGTRYIVFWLRESTPGAEGRILFLSSVTTYNAYNSYGGKSLYWDRLPSLDLRTLSQQEDLPLSRLLRMFPAHVLALLRTLVSAGASSVRSSTI